MTSPLNNIKVVDLSRILAGPWASQLLADMGAEVIKVERPVSGDDTRHWGPPFIKQTTTTQAAYFHCANRNKKSIAVNISAARGQQIIKDLVAQADVFIENFKVGALAKYGLDYQSLKQINPKLVYCSITGFGQTGPYADKAGYDAMIQGEGGLMSITGEPNGEPMKTGVAVVDITTGLYSCNAILAALMARQHTNNGQYIDIALLDVQVAMLANQGMNYLATQKNSIRTGNGHPNIVPYQTFATIDGSLILAIGNDQQFQRFCHAANCSELATDIRFSSNQQRVENRIELIPVLANIIAEQTTQAWLTLLEPLAVPCGAVNTIEQALNHPQIQHRQMVKQLTDKQGELVPTIASPINLSTTPLQYHHAAPELGQHTREVLTDYLAYDQQQLEQLFNLAIIG
jgi:glutaryl-CoA transferase